MKNIEIDDELYLYIVSNTQAIGESASSILRRLLTLDDTNQLSVPESNLVTALKGDDTKQDEFPPNIEVKDSDIVDTDCSEIKIITSSESVFNFINKEELAMQRGAVGRFLLILAALYRAHPKTFNIVTNIAPKVSARKTKRLYFALSEEILTASGSSTKPKQVPQSPFWVITNSNTTRKKMMLTEAASLLGYDESDVIKIRELL
ncbi:replication initiation regulator SeqA [Candidatus Colwellia aromaticivorans]|uniref:replication initiation regulator SeqA n=1 Tax=Candidatus Colwellia aromaticivorans TaxID=2267621 RepID=UPI000DF4ADEC|nr:replication initiation regulator SeqA [Candidatus Colwellia aromaticivorans]